MKSCPLCRNTYPADYQTCPRDQALLTEAANEIAIGTVLRGKYEVLELLGAGGMATVYKVRHKAFQELAAVKLVHQHFMHDPGFVKRFRNEAVVARQLKHPNAVRIDDFDYTEDGRPFIVMEYVHGRSLYQARKDFPNPWPAQHAINIIAQAASALSAAHTLGIVHRDIKPSNILLLRAPDGGVHVKVLDFGIAKVSENPFAGMTSVNTAQSLIIGTPEYMSPEQAAGRLETVIDGRSDLYSLGLVLYELLAGAHPFKADTPMGMLIQQLHTEPAPPESLETSVSPAISALVLKCLEKDPGKRFQNAEQLLAALADVDLWYRSQNHSQTRPEPVPQYAAPAEKPHAGAVATPTLLESEQPPSPYKPSTAGQPASQNGQSHSFWKRYSSILICTGAVCLLILILGVFFVLNHAETPAATTAVATPPEISSAQKNAPEAPQANPPEPTSNPATIHPAPPPMVKSKTSDKAIANPASKQQPSNSPVATVMATRPAIPASQKTPLEAPQVNLSKSNAGVTWVDSATGLEWTKSDNGEDVAWDQANGYCQGLRLAGHNDWRLPTIWELEGIYPGSSLGWHVKGNLRLSGVQWSSSSRRNASGGAWYFGFGGGKRNFSPLNDSTNSRALCVRRSGE